MSLWPRQRNASHLVLLHPMRMAAWKVSGVVLACRASGASCNSSWLGSKEAKIVGWGPSCGSCAHVDTPSKTPRRDRHAHALKFYRDHVVDKRKVSMVYFGTYLYRTMHCLRHDFCSRQYVPARGCVFLCVKTLRAHAQSSQLQNLPALLLLNMVFAG